MSTTSSKSIIGIDFDNTIITYDNIFVDLANKWYSLNLSIDSNKKKVRDFLRSKKNGDLKWQELQTEVYGRKIYKAEPAPGVIEALKFLAHRGYILKIISHKTKFSNIDKKLNLRLAAKTWLINNNIMNTIVPEENIFFGSTQDEKISKIIQEKCGIFIDDLIEVFKNDLFPPEVIQILFSNECSNVVNHAGPKFKSWVNITRYIDNEFRL